MGGELLMSCICLREGNWCFAFPDLFFLVLWSSERKKVVKKEWKENKKQKTILYEKRRNIFV